MSTCVTCYKPVNQCDCPHPDTQTDVYGRVWRVCDSGLALTKASMSRFVMFCLTNNIKIGDLHPFNYRYHGSQVSASVRLRLDQIEDFERETGGKLTYPPRIVLN